MMGGFGGGGMLLWLVAIVALVWWLTQTATSRTAGAPRKTEPERTPKATLDDRLARGEITIEQYRSLRKEIE